MIKVENLTKCYGDFTALDNVSFEINKGDVVGLLGANGAGKTTTMRMITSYFLPTSGKVYIDGLDIEENVLETKKKIGYLPEIPPIYPEMPVEEYLYFLASLRGIEKKEIKKAIDNSIEQVSLQDKRKNKIQTLSKGLKQRVAIAGSIIHSPDILILDEPTVGLDPLQIVDIRELIKKLKNDRTVIISSHILAEVQEMCDKVIILNKGKLVAIDTKENLEKLVSEGVLYEINVKEIDDNLIDLLQGIPGVLTVDNNNSILKIKTEKDDNIRSEISKVIVNNDYSLLGIKEIEMTLEEIFSSLVQED